MARTLSTFITRRSVVAGLAITAVPLSLASADKAYAQDKQASREKSLYERLGGVFAIAAVVDHFSDAVVKNPIVGQEPKNPQLGEWHTKSLERLPGLKFMRTLWVCDVSGGPFKFTATTPGTTPLGLRRLTAISGSPPQSSTKSRGARTEPGSLQGPQTREGRSPGSLCRSQR